jgi:hypothetical protein
VSRGMGEGRVAEIARVVGTMRVGSLDGIEPLAPTYGEVAAIAADWLALTAEVQRLREMVREANYARTHERLL